MSTYESIHTGQAVDQATDRVLLNKSKGTSSTPIYLDANGEAQAISKDATPIENSTKLVESGGVYTELSNKYNKADIATSTTLGTSTTLIPSEGAVKTYTDNAFSGKQAAFVAGDGISLSGSTVSINSTGFMSADKLSGKREHFSEGLTVGTDSDVLRKMEKAKRSTFDISRFSVYANGSLVSNPTVPFSQNGLVITKDGIASGFSSSNYLAKTISINSKSVVLKGKFIFKSSSSEQIFCKLDGTKGAGVVTNIRFSIFANKNMTFVANINNSDVALGGANLSSVLNDGDVFEWEMIIGQTSQQFKYKINGVSDATTPSTIDLSSYNIVCSGVIIGNYSSLNYPVAGSIDLKQFSVTVDGVEVFNGNKQGIDTLKQNYAAPSGGSLPTITTDGIASGFSSTKYLVSDSINISSANEVIIEAQLTVPTTAPEANSTFTGVFYCGVTGVIVSYLTTGISIGACLPAVYSIRWAQENRAYDGSTYIIQCVCTNIQSAPKYYARSRKINETEWHSAYPAEAQASIAGQTSAAIQLGKGVSNFSYPMPLGSLNLSACKIYVDGELVYQPLLKIPYTLTKDGKKIVDSQYRDRVQYEYNLVGYTPYYTLDTETKTYFTKVGSPTINSDYVVSGFSQYVGIQTPTLFSGGFPIFDIYGSFTTSSTPSVGGCVFTFGASDHIGCFIQENADNEVYVFNSSDGSNWNNKFGVTTVSTSTKYYYRVGQDATSCYFYLGTSPNNLQFCGSTTNKTYFPSAGTYMNIGTRPYLGVDQHWQGSIDLRDLKVYVNNKLFYQAVVSPNYTMATVKASDLVAYKTDGVNMYRQYANQTIEQYGVCTESGTVTFEKPFIDYNYALSIPYSSKSSTSFITSASWLGSWKAKGKVYI